MKQILMGLICMILLGGGGYMLYNEGYITIGQDAEQGVAVTGELWVSPYGVQDKVLDWLVDTKYTLSFWLYRLSWKEAIQLIKNLARLGIDISWIGENRPYEGLDKDFLKLKDSLKENNVTVTDDEHLGLNFNHAKVFLRDDESYLIATANLTYSSIWRNREYRFTGNDRDIAASLRYLYEQDLTGKEIELDKLHSSLLLCPVNCRQLIVDKIMQSTMSLYVSAQYLQDEEIRNLLLQRSKEIDVKILVGFWQDEGRLDNFPEGGVKILPEPYLHTKNILVDGSILIHGSMNLSQNSLDNNREIGIMIDDPDVIDTFARQFEKDWNAGVGYHTWEFEK